MVARQLARRGITDPRVLKAMGAVPRERFVPASLAESAYEDSALPIGDRQTISQPWIVAAICQGLELEGSEDVLEIGTGSGYSAAVLAEMSRHVVSIELVPELADRARSTLSDLEIGNVEVRTGDGTIGAAEDESFDAIAVHAAAPKVPPALAAALRVGGRMVIPLSSGREEMLIAIRRVEEGGEIRFGQTPIAACRFVPLLGESGF